MPSSLTNNALFLACLPVMFILAGAAAADTPLLRSIAVAKGIEVPVRIYSARSQKLILWLPSAAEEVASDRRMAARLAKEGIEVWMADILNARFLPELPSSLTEIPGTDVAGVIEAAAASGKRVILLGAGRGALPLLAGAQAWRARHPNDRNLAGAVLLYPHLYIETPEPGHDADYLPIVSTTNLRLVILQPQLSPWYWQLDRLKAVLERGGSSVTVRSYAGVRDRFYFRPETTPAENALAACLPSLLREAVAELVSEKEKPR